MGRKQQKILAIVPNQGLYDQMAPILGRDTLEVSRAPNATGSLILATNVGYELIIAEYPLPDLSIVDFLGILQAPTLPSAKSRILLIARDDHLDGLQRHVEGQERVKVVPQSASAELLQAMVAQSLSSVAARKASRLMVQLHARLGAGRLLRMCQTSNVSESGMLIHTSRPVPLDTEAEISFHLPGDPRPIDGTVKVVRHTQPGKERAAGMGVVFTKLATPARARLREFVKGDWVAPEGISEPAPGSRADLP